jgi:hypothetical protein
MLSLFLKWRGRNILTGQKSLLHKDNAKTAMPFYEFLWTDEIIAHLAEHGVGSDEFQEVVRNPRRIGMSRSSGRPCCWGATATGRELLCVYEFLDDLTIIPVTAFDVSDNG